MKKTIKEYKSELRILKDELSAEIRRRTKAEDRFRMHRVYLRDKFEWFVEILGKGETPNLVWLVKNMTQHFVRVGDFELNELPRAF